MIRDKRRDPVRAWRVPCQVNSQPGASRAVLGWKGPLSGLQTVRSGKDVHPLNGSRELALPGGHTGLHLGSLLPSHVLWTHPARRGWKARGQATGLHLQDSRPWWGSFPGPSSRLSGEMVHIGGWGRTLKSTWHFVL